MISMTTLICSLLSWWWNDSNKIIILPVMMMMMMMMMIMINIMLVVKMYLHHHCPYCYIVPDSLWSYFDKLQLIRTTLISKMIKTLWKLINYVRFNICHQKGYWLKIQMEFLRPILAKIELICQQPQVTGAHPSSGVLERMTGCWWSGLVMQAPLSWQIVLVFIFLPGSHCIIMYPAYLSCYLPCWGPTTQSLEGRIHTMLIVLISAEFPHGNVIKDMGPCQ